MAPRLCLYAWHEPLRQMPHKMANREVNRADVLVQEE